MFSSALKALRKQKRLTQAALAKELFVTQQAVAKWEAGLSFPDRGALLSLARVFGVSVDFLLGNSAPVQPAPLAGFSRVPVIGSIRAGYFSPAFEEDLGDEPADVKDPGRYRYLVVKGDSMEPFIRAGDLALIRLQNDLSNGDLGAFIVGDGEGTIKKYHREKGKVILKPFNPSYEPLVLEGEELSRLIVFGRVVETKTVW